MVHLEQIIKNNEKCTGLINSLQSQLILVQREICELCKIQLRNENVQLQEQVHSAKAKLIQCELKNGKKLFDIPNQNSSSTTNGKGTGNNTECINLTNIEIISAMDKCMEQKHVIITDEESEKENHKGRNSKSNKMQAAKISKSVKTDKMVNLNNNKDELQLHNDIRRLDLRVGKILEAKHHPDADSLYLKKIDCGNGEIRTVISGLVKFIPITEIQNRLVVILYNLKPTKMRGIISEAMVMCASTPEKVEILSPPASAQPGDLIYCEGYPRQPDAILNPKKKIFEACATDLKTNDTLLVCYKSSTLHIPDKGPITAQTLKNALVK